MIESFLITFREVFEASLIVATVISILSRLNQKKEIRTVWVATGSAAAVCFFILAFGSIFGFKIQELYKGTVETVTEGILMIVSAVFISWAVFFLHTYFAGQKTRLFTTIQETVKREEHNGLFWLTFTAVFREGLEITLFLSTTYFSSHPVSIFIGFAGGTLAGLLLAYILFTAAFTVPLHTVFRITNALLIFFAARLLANGVSELFEAGNLSRHPFVPPIILCVYIVFMTWRVFFRNTIAREGKN